MSEYRWWVKNCRIGIEEQGPEKHMLGYIRRSGMCNAVGHFCHVEVSIGGRKVWASGAEDRIFGFHYVHLQNMPGKNLQSHDIHKIPTGMIPAIGWPGDGNNYAYLVDGRVVDLEGREIPRELWFEHFEPKDPWVLLNDRPLTLIERGANFMINHYEALVSKNGRCIVTLPVGSWDAEADVFKGLMGAVSIWNGAPPPWCWKVEEIKSENGWRLVKPEERRVLWRRDEER